MRRDTSALRDLAKSVLFCSLLLVLLAGIDWGMRPTPAGLIPWGALKDTQGEVDVLVLGSSRAHTSVLPMELWRTHGFTCVDVTAGGQTIPTTLAYLEQALETQRPRLVMLEVSMIGRRSNYADIARAHANFDDMPGGSAKTLGVLRSIEPTGWPEFFFALQGYHSRWPELTAYDFLPDKRAKMPWHRGALYLPIVEAIDSVPTTGVVGEADYRADMAVIKQIVARARDEGARVVLFTAPSFAPLEVGGVPLLSVLRSDLGDAGGTVTYLDMSSKVGEMGISVSTDYKDKTHLNHRGAVKLTRWLGEYLAAAQGLPDHRADYMSERWDAALRRYDKDFPSGW